MMNLVLPDAKDLTFCRWLFNNTALTLRPARLSNSMVRLRWPSENSVGGCWRPRIEFDRISKHNVVEYKDNRGLLLLLIDILTILNVGNHDVPFRELILQLALNQRHLLPELKRLFRLHQLLRTNHHDRLEPNASRIPCFRHLPQHLETKPFFQMDMEGEVR